MHGPSPSATSPIPATPFAPASVSPVIPVQAGIQTPVTLLTDPIILPTTTPPAIHAR